MTDAKLIVLLNNHISTAMWCCSPHDGEGLWYTNEYPEEMWIQGFARWVEAPENHPKVWSCWPRDTLATPGWLGWTWGTRSDLSTIWEPPILMIIMTIIITIIIGSHLGNRHSRNGLGGGSGEGWWPILFEHFIDLSPFKKATACWRSTQTCWSSWRGSCQRATWWERSSTRSSWADRRSWSTQATSTPSAPSSRTWTTPSTNPLCTLCRLTLRTLPIACWI